MSQKYRKFWISAANPVTVLMTQELAPIWETLVQYRTTSSHIRCTEAGFPQRFIGFPLLSAIPKLFKFAYYKTKGMRLP
jgi:hypothetical protein